MAKYNITIEDVENGQVTIVSKPDAGTLMKRVKDRDKSLTPADKYAVEFFMIALTISRAKAKRDIILPPGVKWN